MQLLLLSSLRAGLGDAVLSGDNLGDCFSHIAASSKWARSCDDTRGLVRIGDPCAVICRHVPSTYYASPEPCQEIRALVEKSR